MSRAGILALLAAAMLWLGFAARAQAETYWEPGAWDAYKERFISPDGRVIDDGNKDISHSEGQGYGMLLAVFADDPLTFARLWAWTSRELYVRGDDLAAWKWEPDRTPHITDMNNASDGDILIAWALSAAAESWSMPALALQARKIALSVGRHALMRTGYGVTLRPGTTGFETFDSEDGPVINLSYWVFPAFDALHRAAPEIDWAALRKSGLVLLRASQFGPAKLPSDWISLRQKTPAPAKNFPPQFGYNAIRIPLYLIWGGVTDAQLLKPYADLWRAAPEVRPSVINVASGKPAEVFGDAGYRIVPALLRCALNNTPLPAEMRVVSLERYYSATIHMLSLAAARQRYRQCL